MKRRLKFNLSSVLLAYFYFSLQPIIYSCDIACKLTDYAFEDIQEISYLCNAAYSDDFYLEKLRDLSWEIDYLSIQSHTKPFGIKARNGPLTVIAYAGTDFGRFDTVLVDTDIVRLDSKKYFDRLPIKGVMHRGIGEYYFLTKKLCTSLLLEDFASDEKLILCGHSLGGGLAQLQAIDILNTWYKKPDRYPNRFCSIFTLGAPAFLDPNLAHYLDKSFQDNSHLRVFFDNDLFAHYTPGPAARPFHLQRTDGGEGAFVHAGSPIPIQGDGFLTHSCQKYISSIVTRPPALAALWPVWNEDNLLTYFKNAFLSGFSNIQVGDIKLLKQNYRNPAFSAETKEEIVNLLYFQVHFGHLKNHDLKYPYWRSILNADLLPLARTKIFEEHERFYLQEGDAYHPRVFDLVRNLFRRNDLPPRDLLNNILQNLSYTKDPLQQQQLVTFCKQFCEANNYNEKALIPSGNESIFSFAEKLTDSLAKEKFEDLKISIYSHFIRDKNINVNSRFFYISQLMMVEHVKLKLPSPEQKKDIVDLCEESTFERIRREYSMEGILENLELLLGRRTNNPEIYEFATNAVKEMYQADALSVFMGHHIRRYLQAGGVPFTSIYSEEYEKLRSQRKSYIELLNRYTESKTAFETLARDMKNNPHLLEAFLREGLGAEELRKEIIEYVETLQPGQ